MALYCIGNKMEIQDMMEKANSLYSDGLRYSVQGYIQDALFYFSIARAYFDRLEELDGIQECDIMIKKLTSGVGRGNIDFWVNLGQTTATNAIESERAQNGKSDLDRYMVRLFEKDKL